MSCIAHPWTTQRGFSGSDSFGIESPVSHQDLLPKLLTSGTNQSAAYDSVFCANTQLPESLRAADTTLDDQVLQELDVVTRQFRLGDAPPF